MAKTRPDVQETNQRVAVVKSLLIQGSDIGTVMDYCLTEIPEDKSRGIQAKPWTVSRQTARKYIDRALEQIGAEDIQPKDRKRARNRALTTMIIQRLMALGSPTALIGALKGADQLCRIDGSYDPNSMGGALGGHAPATAEEAAAMIEHAAATLALARARGSLAIAASAPTVIDADSVELHDEDEEDDHDEATTSGEPGAN